MQKTAPPDSSSANTDSHSPASPAMTTTVTKRYFSQMKTQADLEETFGCTYGLQIESSPPRLGVFALRQELLGEDSGEQEASEMYRAFFEATYRYRSNIRPEEIRGSLGRVLDTLYAAVRVDHKTKLFSNGLGKTLLYEILTLRRPRLFRVSISTTTNTLYD